MRTPRLAALLVLACHAPACVETVREHRQARFTFASQPPGARIEVLDAHGATIAEGQAPVQVVREYEAEVRRFDGRCWALPGIGGTSLVLGGALLAAGSKDVGFGSTSAFGAGFVIGLVGLGMTLFSLPFCIYGQAVDGRETLLGAGPIQASAFLSTGTAVRKEFPITDAGDRTYRFLLPSGNGIGTLPGVAAVDEPRSCKAGCADLATGAAAAGVDEAGRGGLIRKCFQACGGDPVFTACLWDNVGDAYTPCAGLLK